MSTRILFTLALISLVGGLLTFTFGQSSKQEVSDLGALKQRIAALERRLKALEGRIDRRLIPYNVVPGTSFNLTPQLPREWLKGTINGIPYYTILLNQDPMKAIK